jgi:hypothetical protein
LSIVQFQQKVKVSHVTMGRRTVMCRTRIRFGLLIIILAVAALTGVISAASPDLLGWWKFDEGAGSLVGDATGRGNDGKLMGGPQWINGQLGGALSFNGSTSYVEVPHSTVFDSPSQLTLSAWINPTVLADWCGVITFGINNSPYALQTWSDGAIRLSLNWGTVVGGSGSGSYNSAAGQLKTNQWQHIAATYDGTTIRHYLNAKLVTETAVAVTIGSLNESVTMGCDFPGGDEYFTGGIDDPRIYGKALSEAALADVMYGRGGGDASTPAPKSGATDVPRDAVVSWVAGQYAKTHDVYFGTVFDDVNNASRANPTGVLASQGQADVTYDPAGLLSFGQTYYWRVDEVNGAPDFAIYKGGTWSFTAETYGYPVKPVKATASSSSNALMGPEKTIDGSGLDSLDEHGNSASSMWLSKKNTTPIWIKYDFDNVYKLHEMWVWNSNQATELDAGFGAKDVTIETSLDGTTWTALAGGPVEFNQATGEPNYTHNTTVAFGGVQAKYVRLTISTNWADGTKQAGLSEVRFFYVPVKAYGPTPSSGAAGVAIDSTLNWRPGREAVKHEVYLGLDPNALVLAKTTGDHSLALSPLGLEYGRTYYWKVNEVNDAATPRSWEGDVWSFTTPDYGVVDDFESYNDVCNRIFFAWVDGFGYSASPDCGLDASAGNGTGSTVGNTNPPFAERTIVHEGKQSMPLSYDNTSGKNTSEAIRTFAAAQDWTLGGAKTLVLFFRGSSTNGAGQLYVTINGIKVTYTGTATALSTGLWKQWNIDLASVGTNLKAVKTLAIGVSGATKGTLYVDDIRLYRAAPAPVVPADPASNGLSLWYRMEGNVKDSSGKGLDGTAVGNPAYVDGPAGYGQALSFEGIDDEVDLPIGTLISTSNSMTVGTWVNFNNTGGSWQRLWDFGTGSTAGYMFLCPRQGTTGSMRFAITAAGGTGESIINAPSMVPSGWHYVAVVIDGATKQVQIWQDGDVVASGPTATLPSALGKTTQNWLGRSQYTADAYLTGSLDELRIYNRALSAGEIRYLVGDR